MTDEKFSFEFIDESEMEFVARGRKSNTPSELVNAIKALKPGKAISVPSLKCDPKSKSFGKDKARSGAIIRSAAKIAGVKVTIRWSPAGVPQIALSK